MSSELSSSPESIVAAAFCDTEVSGTKITQFSPMRNVPCDINVR